MRPFSANTPFQRAIAAFAQQTHSAAAAPTAAAEPTPASGFVQQVTDYCDSIGLSVTLSSTQFRQLYAMQNTRGVSPTEPLHNNAKRALVRLQCLLLLAEGSEKAYGFFTHFQPESCKLTWESFQKLSRFISTYRPCEFEYLQESCFTATNDNSGVMSILFVEGGHKSFINQFPKNTTAHLIVVALCQGIIDIAGHIVRQEHSSEKNHGSVFLTQNIATPLLYILYKLNHGTWRRQPFDFFINGYLKFLCKLIGTESPYLAHIAALMGIFTADGAKPLVARYNQISPIARKSLEQNYAAILNYLGHTTTFERNIYIILQDQPDQDIGNVMAMAVLIHAQVYPLYAQKRDQKHIDPKTVLCYRLIAQPDILASFSDHFKRHMGITKLDIDAAGNVIVARNQPPPGRQ